MNHTVISNLWMIPDTGSCDINNRLKIGKGQQESVNRRTDDKMAKKYRQKNKQRFKACLRSKM